MGPHQHPQGTTTDQSRADGERLSDRQDLARPASSPSEAACAAVFEEWLRRYQADPATFNIVFGEPGTYGEHAARYFLALLHEQAQPF